MIWAKYKLAIIAVIGAFLLIVAAFVSGYVKGGASCEARHAVEQLKVTEKLGKTDAKIDKSTPFGASEQRVIEWLRQYGRHE